MKKLIILILLFSFIPNSFALDEIDNDVCKVIDSHTLSWAIPNLKVFNKYFISIDKVLWFSYVDTNENHKYNVVTVFNNSNINWKYKEKRIWKEFDELHYNSIIKSKDGFSIAYVWKRDWENTLAINDKLITGYSEISKFTFSPDWKSYAFFGKNKNWEWILVKNWKRFWNYTFLEPSSIYFSKDSKHIFYLKRVLISETRRLLAEGEDYIDMDELACIVNAGAEWRQLKQGECKRTSDYVDVRKYNTTYHIDNDLFQDSKYRNLEFYLDYSSLSWGSFGNRHSYEPDWYFKFDIKDQSFVPVKNNILNLSWLNSERSSNLLDQDKMSFTNKIYSNNRKSYFKIIQYVENYRDKDLYSVLEKNWKKYNLGTDLYNIYKPTYFNNNIDISYVLSKWEPASYWLYPFSSESYKGLYFFINDKYLHFDEIYYKENIWNDKIQIITRKWTELEKIECDISILKAKELSKKLEIIIRKLGKWDRDKELKIYNHINKKLKKIKDKWVIYLYLYNFIQVQIGDFNSKYRDNDISKLFKVKIKLINIKSFTSREKIQSFKDFWDSHKLTNSEKELLKLYIIIEEAWIELTHQNYENAHKLLYDFFNSKNWFNMGKLNFSVRNLEYSNFMWAFQYISFGENMFNINKYRLKHYTDEKFAPRLYTKITLKSKLDCGKMIIKDYTYEYIDNVYCNTNSLYNISGGPKVENLKEDFLKAVISSAKNLTNLNDNSNYYLLVMRKGLYNDNKVKKDELFEKIKVIWEKLIEYDKSYVNWYLILKKYYDYNKNCDKLSKYDKLLKDNYLWDESHKYVFNTKYENCTLSE